MCYCCQKLEISKFWPLSTPLSASFQIKPIRLPLREWKEVKSRKRPNWPLFPSLGSGKRPIWPLSTLLASFYSLPLSTLCLFPLLASFHSSPASLGLFWHQTVSASFGLIWCQTVSALFGLIWCQTVSASFGLKQYLPLLASFDVKIEAMASFPSWATRGKEKP